MGAPDGGMPRVARRRAPAHGGVCAGARRDRRHAPDEERATFGELLTEAQFTFSARDDHAMVGGIGTIGIMQGAMKAAGRRLGLGDLALHLSLSELAGALRDGSSPDALARERAAF